jgi:serine phosphatase RsbU (regulator of sigma subunit)
VDDGLLDVMISVGSQVGQFTERRAAERALHEREAELSVAREIQKTRLPNEAPALAGFAIGAASQPAQETGGDYFDFIPLPDGSLAIAVGDASGHGIGAAMLMAEARACLRARALTDTDVGLILSRVNRQLAADLGDGHFITFFLAALDSRAKSLVYVNAGHWPGYVLDARGELRTVLRSTNMPLGIDPLSDLRTSARLALSAGDLVLLLTDGIVETFSPDGRAFGAERALRTVRAHCGESPAEIISALFQEVGSFGQDVQVDDRTAIVIKVEK